jgi:hypothetical protein
MSEIHFEPEDQSYEDGYTVVTNNIIVDKDLTDSAKILLIYLMSNSPTWKVYGRFTAKLLGWGKEKLSSAIRCLYTLGYITRIQNREKGKWTHYTYRYSNKPKFKNPAWQSQFKSSGQKPEMLPNVDETPSTPETLPVEAVQPKRQKPAPVQSSPDNRPLPKPNKPMPNLNGYEGNASLSSKSKAMDASRTKQDPATRGRKHKRPDDEEDRFQWLLGLHILDEKGYLNEDALSYLAHTYTRKRLEDAYFHMLHKIQKKSFKAKSPIAVFRHLLENEHNCRGTDAELNEAFARKFASDLGWGSLLINENYVIDKNVSAKDLSLNMEPAAFRSSLENLYLSIHGSFTNG